jgi:hypothetical protein
MLVAIDLTVLIYVVIFGVVIAGVATGIQNMQISTGSSQRATATGRGTTPGA